MAKWSQKHPRISAVGGVIMLIATGLATIQGIWNLFSNEPLFQYISESIPLWPRILIVVIFISIFILCLVLVISIFRQTKKGIETKPDIVSGSVNLCDTLTAMHRRLIELQKEKASTTKIGFRQWEKVTPTLADRMGTVKLKDWPKFLKSIKRRIQQKSPRPNYSQRSTFARFREFVKYRERVQHVAVDVALEVKREFFQSKGEWTIEDGVKISGWLDGYHWGVKELRDNDPQWNTLFKSIDHFLLDTKLRELIDKHIDASYVYNTVCLVHRYSERYAKGSFASMLHEALVGSPISPEKMEIALSELLSEIEKRLAEINELQNIKRPGKLDFKVDVQIEDNSLYVIVTNKSEEDNFRAKAKLANYSGDYLDGSWFQLYSTYWERSIGDLGFYRIFKGLSGKIKLASFESMQAPEVQIPSNTHLRLYRIMSNSLDYIDSHMTYVVGSSIGVGIPEYVFNVNIFHDSRKYQVNLNIKIDLAQKLEWSQEISFS